MHPILHRPLSATSIAGAVLSALQPLLLGAALLFPTEAAASLCVCRSQTYVWPHASGPVPVNTVLTVAPDLVERLRLKDKTKTHSLRQVSPPHPFLWTRMLYPHFTTGETFVIEHQEPDGAWRPISPVFTSSGRMDQEEPRWSGKVTGTFVRTGDVPGSCSGAYSIELRMSEEGYADDTTPWRDLRWAVWYDLRVGVLHRGGEAPLLGDPPALLRPLDPSGSLRFTDGRDQCPVELTVPVDATRVTLWVAPVDYAGHVGAVVRVPLVASPKR